MSSERNNKTESVIEVRNDQQQDQENNFTPNILNEMLQNKELLTCYKCHEQFSLEDQDEHQLDSNNILLGIIINKRTPSSICLNCLSNKMMDVIVERFTKNSKDYEGLFFSYDHKFKG